MVRSGARSPLINPDAVSHGYWLCDTEDALAPRIHAAPIDHFRRFRQVLDQRLTDWPPNCRSGDLILSGMDQQKSLGQFYHEYLFDNNRLFSSLPIPPSQLNVRASDLERTFRSAQGFLAGCFPPQSPNEIIDILTDTSDGSLLRLNWAWFQDGIAMRDRYTQTDQYKDFIDAAWSNISDFAAEIGITSKSDTNIEAVCNYVTTHTCADKRLPVTAGSINETCFSILGSFWYDFFESNRTVLGSYIVRELMRIPKLVANQSSEVKFSLESSHDSAMAAVMVFLSGRLGYENLPPPASHLSLEMWKGDGDADFTVRWVLNGRLVPLREMGDATEVGFRAFLEAYKDMDRYCLELQ
jgi:acid phosphatase